MIALVVTACSVTVGGTGTRTPAGSVPASSSTPAGQIPPAIPSNLRRTPVSTTLGDPDLLDWCSAVPRAVTGYGALEPEQVTSAGTCYLTLQSSDNAQQLEVTVDAVPISQVTRTVATAAKKVLVSGVPMYVLGTEKEGDCSYFLAWGGLGIDIDELQNRAPAAVCPVERAVATALANRFVHGPRIPTFAAPPWSLATANVCRVALTGEAINTPPLQHVAVDERLLGSGCLLLGDQSEVYATAARATAGYTYPSPAEEGRGRAHDVHRPQRRELELRRLRAAGHGRRHRRGPAHLPRAGGHRFHRLLHGGRAVRRQTAARPGPLRPAPVRPSEGRTDRLP